MFWAIFWAIFSQTHPVTLNSGFFYSEMKTDLSKFPMTVEVRAASQTFKQDPGTKVSLGSKVTQA
jgi:hypothetical protein